MILRARYVWGMIVLFAFSPTIWAKPPKSPTEPGVDGTATPTLTQEYFQADPAKNKLGKAQLHREVASPRPGLPVAEFALKLWKIAISGCE
jgi:hypothetical protein